MVLHYDVVATTPSELQGCDFEKTRAALAERPMPGRSTDLMYDDVLRVMHRVASRRQTDFVVLAFYLEEEGPHTLDLQLYVRDTQWEWRYRDLPCTRPEGANILDVPRMGDGEYAERVATLGA